MRPRVSIRVLMAAVLFVAIAAALRSASPLWASAIFTATLGILATAALGACFAVRQRRTFWAGAAIFGWGYLVLAFGPWFSERVAPCLFTTEVLERLFHRANPVAITNVMGALPPIRTYYHRDPTGMGPMIWVAPEHFQRLGHSLFALLLAVIGGNVARAFAAGPDATARDAVNP